MTIIKVYLVNCKIAISTGQPLYLNYVSCYYIIIFVPCLVLDYNVLCRINVKYSVFLRRNCLVGRLCYEILELLELCFPIDGNCVINYFLWTGDTRILNGVLSNFRQKFLMHRLCLLGS